MNKLFGTDGVRGIANEELTAELAYNIGRATACILAKGKKSEIVIGRDTRKSGHMLQGALIAGLNSMGVDVISTGIIPTPAVSYLTREYNAAGGIVISASHNPGEYNGIKIFDSDGIKLSEEEENEIENLVINKFETENKYIGEYLGKVYYEPDSSKRYKEYVKEIIGVDLSGLKIAMDCGNGALYKIGPEVVEELNGEVIAINTKPDGMNINDNCGSTNSDLIVELTLKEDADIGISFDGDGDRIIASDNKGNIINGDHILAIASMKLKEDKELRNNTVVGTIMTNMGLDSFLEKEGIDIVKTSVGDKYVLEEMLKKDYVLGGEQSGHIIFLDYNTTGDGLVTGLYLLKVLKESGKDMAELNSLFKDYPQILTNIKVNNKDKNICEESVEIKNKISYYEKKLDNKGRIVIRPSGTEPLIRVMVEGEDKTEINNISRELSTFIAKKLKA